MEDGGENTTGTPNHPKSGRRVMVVADPNRESAGALQYALSHAMVEDDELILLHVTSRRITFSSISSIFRKQHDLTAAAAATNVVADEGNGGGGIFGGIFGDGGGDFIEVMKRASEKAFPNMKVSVDKVDQGNMDKGAAILCRSNLLGVDILIIGQRRNLSSILLGPKRNGGALLGGARATDTAEFLIEHSACTCVGVQKKGQNGGYVLNTKTHRNFWLLA